MVNGSRDNEECKMSEARGFRVRLKGSAFDESKGEENSAHVGLWVRSRGNSCLMVSTL